MSTYPRSYDEEYMAKPTAADRAYDEERFREHIAERAHLDACAVLCKEMEAQGVDHLRLSAMSRQPAHKLVSILRGGDVTIRELARYLLLLGRECEVSTSPARNYYESGGFYRRSEERT